MVVVEVVVVIMGRKGGVYYNKLFKGFFLLMVKNFTR